MHPLGVLLVQAGSVGKAASEPATLLKTVLSRHVLGPVVQVAS